MKKFLIGVLVTCLLIGIPFMGMDFIAKNKSPFNIPAGYEKIKVDLSEKARNDEVVYTKEFKKATELTLMVQSDSNSASKIKIATDQKLIGSNISEKTYEIANMTGYSYMSPKFILRPGKFTITVTNAKTDGNIVIGYKEKEMDNSYYERLVKIDNGDLDNPPEGYELAYSTDLSELDCKQETVYTLSLDHSQLIGLSVYTSASKGKVSVDFIGDNSNFIGLVQPNVNKICDQLENTYQKGTYKIQLTSQNANGQIYIFIKK